MQGEDLIFNFEDMNVSEETTNIFEQETNIKPDSVTEEVTEKEEETINETPTIEVEETPSIEIDETSSKETPSAEADSSQSTLYALAKYLKDEGVLFLDSELEKVDTIEDLKSLIAESHNKAKYNNMSESQQRYLDALESGVPVKEYEKIEKEIQNFSNIKEENIANDPQLQYELIAIDFINSGIDQEKAMKLAKLSVQSEEDSFTEAKNALNKILDHKNSKYRQLLESKKEKTEIDLKTIKETLDSKKEILSMEVNDNTKNKLFDYMTTKVGNDDNGLPLNKLQKFQRDNPVEANIIMNYLFMMTNEGKDLGLIKTTSTSSASKELEKKLKQLNFDSNGSLLIPDEMVSNKRNNNNNKENLTINI